MQNELKLLVTKSIIEGLHVLRMLKIGGFFDTAAYKQFGNSVAVPVVEAVARKMIQALSENKSLLTAEEERVPVGK
ncbi:DNA cytosine methyltransferase [Paenibacillus ehimensis]|uniref:DNA cytosine methyltransferase n=1 Tax=Paenibacillus ehimensis TaxID=79264 RepID=UPI00398B672A